MKETCNKPSKKLIDGFGVQSNIIFSAIVFQRYLSFKQSFFFFFPLYMIFVVYSLIRCSKKKAVTLYMLLLKSLHISGTWSVFMNCCAVNRILYTKHNRFLLGSKSRILSVFVT